MAVWQPRKGNVMQRNIIAKFTLNFNPETQPVAPEEEILRIFQYLGFLLICGQIDVPSFDQIVNGLIKTCRGDFQCELINTKTKIKFILDQTQGDR